MCEGCVGYSVVGMCVSVKCGVSRGALPHYSRG